MLRKSKYLLMLGVSIVAVFSLIGSILIFCENREVLLFILKGVGVGVLCIVGSLLMKQDGVW